MKIYTSTHKQANWIVGEMSLRQMDDDLWRMIIVEIGGHKVCILALDECILDDYEDRGVKILGSLGFSE